MRYSPVVRTNPVTGWKSLFGAGHQIHAGWIDNVTETESEVIKTYCKFRICLSSKVLPPSSKDFKLTKLHSPSFDLREPRPAGSLQMEPE
jgi:hypothetical protein